MKHSHQKPILEKQGQKELLVAGNLLTNISDSLRIQLLICALGLVTCMRPQRGLR